MLNKIFKFFIWISLGISFLYANPIRIMPLGDSITYDDAWVYYQDPIVPDSLKSGYRNHLWYMLEEANYGADFVGSRVAGEAVEPAFDPDNEGHPGWNSFEIAEDTYKFMEISSPDIVLLHIGTNDHDDYVGGVNDILNRIDEYERDSNKNIKVYVALIIDRWFSDYHIIEFNYNLEDLIYSRINNGDDLVLVDMYREAGLTGADYLENSHPNDEGYKKMAQVWFNALTTPYTPKLHAYPYSIIDKQNIQSVNVNESEQTVVFTTSIPDTGITF